MVCQIFTKYDIWRSKSKSGIVVYESNTIFLIITQLILPREPYWCKFSVCGNVEFTIYLFGPPEPRNVLMLYIWILYCDLQLDQVKQIPCKSPAIRVTSPSEFRLDWRVRWMWMCLQYGMDSATGHTFNKACKYQNVLPMRHIIAYWPNYINLPHNASVVKCF